LVTDLLPGVPVEFPGGCSARAAALEGWPRPACEAAQAARASAQSPTPIFFNASLALNASLVLALAQIYAAINAASDALVHRDMLPWPISQFAASGSGEPSRLLTMRMGWQAARAHANSMSAMMQVRSPRVPTEEAAVAGIRGGCQCPTTRPQASSDPAASIFRRLSTAVGSTAPSPSPTASAVRPWCG
jgi:hypothetical protein